ncbi:hypothetical protein KJ591_00415 [Patescibacteria group bacterium]|nr:hypothetical protein [Patescibacteria group bacterium]MBU4022819.1 hypothetical protein [Patescibacteria group bacterium]MBU4162281.1 hypothetical protein [Patescibacteria group bacterium]
MKFLQKIQSLSLEKRKMVLWVSVAIIGLIFLIVFLAVIAFRFKSFDFQNFGQQLNIPSFEIPDLNE